MHLSPPGYLPLKMSGCSKGVCCHGEGGGYYKQRTHISSPRVEIETKKCKYKYEINILNKKLKSL